MDSPTTAPPNRWLPAFLRSITLRSVGITLALAALAALGLNPIFHTPFLELLWRTLFIATMLLLAFNAAGQWRQSLMPRWAAQLLAVALAAPLMTAVVYVLSSGGDIAAFIGQKERVTGFLFIAGTGLVLGVLLALAALFRERDARLRAQELQFALEKSTLERQALDARLRMLHAQIEPHFLFNTLANVQALVESGSGRAAPVLQSLIDYLRAAMPTLSAADHTLGAEAALVTSYLQLMQLRMPDRLQFDVRVEPALAGCRFPSMALLTLVENAVRHGIDPGEQGGRIDVGSRRDASGALHVWVDDSGGGMPESARPGTGLTNLRERLDAFYAGRARLEMSENAPHGLRAEIVVSAEGAR